MSYYKTLYKYGFPEIRTIELLRWKNNIQKNNIQKCNHLDTHLIKYTKQPLSMMTLKMQLKNNYYFIVYSFISRL